MGIKLTIKNCRDFMNLSQDEMAKLMNKSVGWYREKESYANKMDIEEAYLFSRIVNVPMDDIIFFK